MIVVWRGAAKLVVSRRLGMQRARRRAVLQILVPSAPTIVAHDCVELAIRAETDDATIVVAPERLPGIGLIRVQSN